MSNGPVDEIELTATEFELLRFLMRNPRRVLSKAQILDRVWDYDFGGQANVVELYISYLRKKIDLGHEPMIHTNARRRLRAQTGRVGPVRKLLPSSLTGRLVVTVVALVAVASLLVAGAVTVVMRQLPDRSSGREAHRSRWAGPGTAPAFLRRTDGDPATVVQTRDAVEDVGLITVVPDRPGSVVTADGEAPAISTAARDLLAEVTPDGKARDHRPAGVRLVPCARRREGPTDRSASSDCRGLRSTTPSAT